MKTLITASLLVFATLQAGAQTTETLTSNCALKKIVKAVKKTTAEQFGNHPYSSGRSAFGVRLGLQASRVGSIENSLGNAVDYVAQLPPRGFVDLKTRDLNSAPAGSVIVFSGPKTAAYLKTGIMSRPYGGSVGHVTIKGNDRFYYSDGRTVEPAMGWKDGINIMSMRNIMAIFVPGPQLIEQFQGQCE